MIQLSPFSRLRFHDLRAAWHAAAAELSKQRTEVEADWQAYSQRIDRGEACLEEIDAEGQVVYDHGEAAGDRLRALDSAARLVNEAFAVSFWHLLEREILSATGAKRISDAPAKSLLATYSPQLQADIEQASHLANLLKHGPGKSGDALFARAPHLFDKYVLAEAGGQVTPDALHLTDALLQMQISIVDQALPRFRGLPLVAQEG